MWAFHVTTGMMSKEPVEQGGDDQGGDHVGSALWTGYEPSVFGFPFATRKGEIAGPNVDILDNRSGCRAPKIFQGPAKSLVLNEVYRVVTMF